ncbi:MAG: hypothetical protein K6E21_04660 [Bacilli bacterium]|nr:hypothetical protein [Bacilli bacterium]
MKKNKIIGVVALASMMGLSGCNLLDNVGGACAHQWSVWEIIEEPTCQDRGQRERYCELCGKVQTRSIAIDNINGHNWVDDEGGDKVATCTEHGITGSKYCTRCYQKKRGTETELGAHSMERSNPQPSDPKYKDSTCEESGLYQEKCRFCGITNDVAIDKKGHKEAAPDFSGGKVGVVRCSTCGDFIAYELDIKDAKGFNTPTVRMGARSGDSSKAVWDISSCIGDVIPAGSYDILLEAAMTDSAHGTRKMYNMARKDLVVEGDDNNLQGSPDSIDESAYRYYVKVDATNYYPTTKESFADLGLSVGTSNFKYVNFLEGVSINKESTSLEFIHGNIGYSLYVKSIRLKPHNHTMETSNVPAGTNHVGYTLDKCNKCGYRKITIAASEAVATNLDTTAPAGHVRLAADSDKLTFNINLDENISGSLFLTGRQSTSNMDETPFNIIVENNGEVISGDWSGKKSSDYFNAEGDTGVVGYSNEGRLLIGEVDLRENTKYGTNQLVITRTGDYNIALKEIVIEGRPTGHIHELVHKSEDDTPATCRSNRTEAWVCSCGLTEKRVIQDTKTPHDFRIDTDYAPTCESEGTRILVCNNCGQRETIITPKAHDMVTVDAPDGAEYELKKCSKCGLAVEATWTLNQAMIKDYNGSEYVQTAATAKSGKMSDGITQMTVFKFDTANRRVVLNYSYDGDEAVDAMLSMFATTKASEVERCNAYKENSAKKLSITVNGDEVSYKNAYNNKTMADLGLTNTESNVNDNGAKLADAKWLQYYEVELIRGMNEIVIDFPLESEYPLYIGGFRLSY